MKWRSSFRHGLSHIAVVSAMAPSKKRAAPSQGSTLLDFFGEGNSKTKPTPKKPKSESETERPKVKNERTSGFSAADAIVIEDDDEVATSSDTLKSKDSQNFGDLESLTFGRPILLSSSPPREEVQSDAKRILDNDSGSERIVDDCLSEFVKVNKEEGTLFSDLKTEDMADDEWALGDDEVVEDNGDGYQEDTEEMSVDDLEETSSSCEKSCPLCGESIVGMSSAVNKFHFLL